MSVGAVVPVTTVYLLSRDWYRGRLELNWQRPSAEEATARFAAHGLTGAFWDLT
jgi:hypothetical protein